MYWNLSATLHISKAVITLAAMKVIWFCRQQETKNKHWWVSPLVDYQLAELFTQFQENRNRNWNTLVFEMEGFKAEITLPLNLAFLSAKVIPLRHSSGRRIINLYNLCMDSWISLSFSYPALFMRHAKILTFACHLKIN